MGLVEEEHQLRLVEIAGFRQPLEQLRQQPQQERRVQRRLLVQHVGREDVDDAAAGHVLAHQVVEIERRLAEEAFGTVGFKRDQAALDRADRGLRDQPVVRPERLGVFRDMVKRRFQVLQIEQQQALVIAELEHQLQHGFLDVRQVQQPRQQQRPEVRNRAAQRMALGTEDIPEHHRVDGRRVAREADMGGALDQLRLDLAGHRQPGQIALDVGREHRHAEIAEAFAQALQRHRLAGASGPGDQAVAVAVPGEQPLLRAVGGGAFADEDIRFHAVADPAGAGALASAARGAMTTLLGRWAAAY